MPEAFIRPKPGIITKSKTAPISHIVEAELLGLRPRPVVWVGATLFWRLVLRNILAGIAVVLFVLAERDITAWTALIERGEPIKAAVYARYETHTPRRTDGTGEAYRYFLQYRFAAEGQTFRGEKETDAVDYYDPNNDKILVTYLPGSGGVYQVGTATKWRRADRFWDWIIGAGFALGVCGAAIAAHNYVAEGDYRLLRLGVAAPATVASGMITRRKKVPTHWIDYRFVARDKRTYTGKASVPRKVYEAQVWGQSELTVLYNEAKPDENALYRDISAARVLGK